MSKFIWVSGALALALLPGFDARAADDADLAAIRAQINVLKADYDSRIGALEERLKAAEARNASVRAPLAATPPPPAPPSSPASSLAAFNPAISAILNGTYANLSQDPARFRMSGFAPAPDAGPGRRGFSLGESEIAFAANVDHEFSGNLIFSITPEDRVAVEEAYGILTSAPAGITPKFGRFFSGVGYLNEQHAHAWDFVDAPLAYQAFLGGQYQTEGAQLTWIAPVDQFIELGAEAGSGAAFPGTDRGKNGAGSGVAFVRTGGDVGTSSSWLAGVSYLGTAARDRSLSQPDDLGDGPALGFTGTSHIAAADFVWKWAPNGNPHTTNFKLQGEYLWRRERGDVAGASGSSLPASAAYASRQDGWYVQGVYQFMPLWRAGLRYDQLDAGSVDAGAFGDQFPATSLHPHRATAMLDWSPSEFSRVRLQFAQAKLVPGATDNQWFLQYILSIGAHGAHKY